MEVLLITKAKEEDIKTKERVSYLLNESISNDKKKFGKKIIRNEKEGTIKILNNKTKRQIDNKCVDEHSNHRDNSIYTGKGSSIYCRLLHRGLHRV